ncbi:MAG: restriction endonuclease [Clostridia bacterium]|nr:restriction endonuclease [Clostridia bacterium]
MRVTNKIKRRATENVIKFLSNTESATRTEIIEGALNCYGLCESELEDFSPKSKNSVIRSYISTVINDLINKKDLVRKGDRYSLAKEELVIIKEELVEAEIKEILQKGAYTKNEIFRLLESRFGTDITPSFKDDYSLHSAAGTALFNLLQNDEIEFIDGKYRDITPVELDEKTDTPLPENEFKPKFFKKLWLMGGKFFESFVANLLEKYFTLSGKMVVYCDITGGSDDGGLDIELEIVDYLGFVETIVAQTKCRDRAHVTEKEVREFYGAMNAKRATRGIYVTTTRFHESAQDFIDAIGDLVGIDGDKLFSLVKRTSYGINKHKDGYTFDEGIFAN